MSVVTWDVVALVLGIIVAIGLAVLTSPLAEQTDESMVWEGRVAVGFGALVFVGPFWLAQGIVTVVAMFTDHRVGPLWSWAWFVAAPLVGVSPPATAVVRAVQRAVRRGRGTDHPRAG